MTDLEITRLCAEAMGYRLGPTIAPSRISALKQNIYMDDQPYHTPYDPLHDDAQAMALVKRLGLILDPQHDGQDFATDPGWEVSHPSLGDELFISPDLNRAICECVAKMQAAK